MPYYESEKKITLVDSLLKRVNYLNTIIKDLELNDIVAIHARGEDVKEKFDIVFSDMVSRYVDAINRVTPTDHTDPRMALIKLHAGTLLDIYQRMPVDEAVMHKIEDFCYRPEVESVLYEMYE
mgnify:CR=1 FL=1